MSRSLKCYSYNNPYDEEKLKRYERDVVEFPAGIFVVMRRKSEGYEHNSPMLELLLLAIYYGTSTRLCLNLKRRLSSLLKICARLKVYLKISGRKHR